MGLKKIFKIVVLIIILLGVFYWSYKFYNNTSSLLGVVHQDANAILKVDTHSIKETLVLDALTAPKYYYTNISSSGKTDKEKKDKQKKGIDLNPYMLVLYTLKNVENTVFTTLPIDDEKDFNAYIKTFIENKKCSIEKAKGYQFAQLENSKICIGWSATHLAIAASPEHIKISKIAPVFTDVFVHRKLISDKKNKLIQKIKSANDHIVFANNKSVIGLNFEDGQLTLQGKINTKNTMSFKKEMKVNKVTDASIQIHFDYNLDNEGEKINLIRIFQNNSFLQKSNLNITPISNFINGYFSLAINGKTMQKDTIVSYSYDDNFNKVEEKKVQEKEAPKMYLNLGTQKEGFQNYLQTKGAIEHGIFTAFPYYNFHVSSTANTTLFATSKTQPETTTVKISNFLDCKIDFNKLKNDVSFPKSDLIFSLLNNFNLSANVLDQNKIALQGALTVNNNDVNIITQLFFGLENSK